MVGAIVENAEFLDFLKEHPAEQGDTWRLGAQDIIEM